MPLQHTPGTLADPIDSPYGSTLGSRSAQALDIEKAQLATQSTDKPAGAQAAKAWAVRGNPAPLGLLGFGMTTCMLMFVTTSWSPAGAQTFVICYAFFYGGLAQLLAGILELIRGNTFAGTAFSSYGAFWLGWGLEKYFEARGMMANVLTTARTGDSLWCGLWGFLTLFFFVVTLRKNLCLQTVFLTLAITFFLLIGANYSAQCKKAAGYVGFFCGCSAIYTALAEVYEIELGYRLPGLAPRHWI